MKKFLGGVVDILDAAGVLAWTVVAAVMVAVYFDALTYDSGSSVARVTVFGILSLMCGLGIGSYVNKSEFAEVRQYLRKQLEERRLYSDELRERLYASHKIRERLHDAANQADEAMRELRGQLAEARRNLEMARFREASMRSQMAKGTKPTLVGMPAVKKEGEDA